MYAKKLFENCLIFVVDSNGVIKFTLALDKYLPVILPVTKMVYKCPVNPTNITTHFLNREKNRYKISVFK